MSSEILLFNNGYSSLCQLQVKQFPSLIQILHFIFSLFQTFITLTYQLFDAINLIFKFILCLSKVLNLA